MKNIDRKAGEGSSSSSNKSVWNTGSPDDTLDMSVEEITDAKDPHAADGYIKAANANPETPSFGDAAHNKQDKHGLHHKVIAGMLVAALASGVGVAAKGMAEQKTVDNGNRRGKSFYVPGAEASETSETTKVDDKAAEGSSESEEKIKEYYTSYEDEKGTTTSHWEVGPDGKETRGMSSYTPRPEGAEYDGSITGSRTDILENGEQRKKSFTMNSSERMEKAKERKDLSATEEPGADDEVEAAVTVAD